MATQHAKKVVCKLLISTVQPGTATTFARDFIPVGKVWKVRKHLLESETQFSMHRNNENVCKTGRAHKRERGREGERGRGSVRDACG